MHVDLHGEWVRLRVAAMYNVLAILSVADMVCLACCRNCGVHEQCWVCMVCMSLKLCCEILLLLNMVDMDR